MLRTDHRRGEVLNISAELLNEVGRLKALLARQSQTPTVGVFRETPQATVIQVENGTGGDLARFSVVGIDSPIIDPTDDEPAGARGVTVYGVTPDEDYHKGRFAVLQEPIADGEIGAAVVAGVTWATVYASTANPRYAELTDADATMLTADDGGSADVLWCESGTGNLWAIVRLGRRPRLATMFFAQVNEVAGVEYTDATFSIDNITGISPPGAYLDPEPTTVDNLLMLPYENNARVLCIRHTSDDDWVALGAIHADDCA